MKRFFVTVIVIILAILFISPVAATLLCSFRTGRSINLDAYKELLFNCFLFYPMFWNSVLYSTIITAFQLLVIIPCAFGFIYAKFKGKKILYIFYIMLMMMPLQVTILPNYIGLRDLNLINHRLGIILPMIFSPFGVIVMHQFMKGIDDGVIEAARIETSSMVRILLTAVVPQLRVCIFAVVLFVFADSWNMVEQPMLFLKMDSLKTITIFLSQVDNYSSFVLFSASIIFMIPIFLMYLFFNDSLEKGLILKDFS